MVRSIARAAEPDRKLLQEWVAQNSGSSNLFGLAAMRELLRKRGAFLPVSAEELPPTPGGDPASGPSALRWIRHRSGERPRVLLNGHLDTVYAADHPFQRVAEPNETTWNGPGVADMKGGLVILFRALEAFLQTSRADRLDWEILLTSDEETGSAVGERWLTEAAHRNDFGIAFESSMPGGALIRNRMGVGEFRITAIGKAAHTGRDFAAGRNAVVALAQFVTTAHELNERIPGAILSAGQFQSEGPLNVVPDRATVGFNVRVAERAAQEAITGAFDELATGLTASTGCTFRIDGGFLRPPKVVDERTEQLFAAWQKVGNQLGESLSWRDTGGTSDGNLLQAAGLPIIDNLGVIGGNLHSPEEWADVNSLTSRAQLVAAFLYAAAGGELELPVRSRP